MPEKGRVRKIFKYSFLSLSLISYGFILYQSAITGGVSSQWGGWASAIWIDLLNVKLGLKENVKDIDPESLDLKVTDSLLNKVSGYQENEIPLGCAKQLTAEILPFKANDKTVSFVATPSDAVNLVSSGNTVTIEALKKGLVTIEAKSNVDNSLVDQYCYSIVDLVKPASFDLPIETITLKKGTSYPLDIIMSEQTLGDNQVKLSRYYDVNKLSISSSNVTNVDVNGTYIKAKEVGASTITISNEMYTKNIDVIVQNNENPIVDVTSSFNIVGDNKVHILDVDGENFTKLSVDWGSDNPTDKNVVWSVSNPLAAIVNQSGEVRGYRNIDSKNDVDFVVTATSVSNPTIKQDFNMKLCHVVPTKISLNNADSDNKIIVAKGKTTNLNVTFAPNNVTLKDFTFSVGDESVAKVTKTGNSISVVGLKDGSTTIQVASSKDPNVKSEVYTLEVDTREIINEDNHDNFVYIVRKYIGGHALLFMLFGFFTSMYLYLAHEEKSKKILIFSFISSVILGFVLSGLSEIIQLFTPGRMGLFSDVGIDMLGYGMGFIGALVISLVIYKVTNRNKKTIIKW